jgi:hypothetical protein
MDMNGEPTDCRECAGGFIWAYPNGSVSKYPGGPMLGSVTKKELSYIGSGTNGKSTFMEQHYD